MCVVDRQESSLARELDTCMFDSLESSFSRLINMCVC